MTFLFGNALFNFDLEGNLPVGSASYPVWEVILMEIEILDAEVSFWLNRSIKL